MTRQRAFLDEIFIKAAEIEAAHIQSKDPRSGPFNAAMLKICAEYVGPFCTFDISKEDFFEAIEEKTIASLSIHPSKSGLVYKYIDAQTMQKYKRNRQLTPPLYGFVGRHLIIAAMYIDDLLKLEWLFIKRGRTYHLPMMGLDNTTRSRQGVAISLILPHFCDANDQLHKKSEEATECAIRFLVLEKYREDHPQLLQIINYEHIQNSVNPPHMTADNDDFLAVGQWGYHWRQEAGNWRKQNDFLELETTEEFIKKKATHANAAYLTSALPLLIEKLREEALELQQEIADLRKDLIEQEKIYDSTPLDSKESTNAKKEAKRIATLLKKAITTEEKKDGNIRKLVEYLMRWRGKDKVAPKKVQEQIAQMLFEIEEPEADSIFTYEPQVQDPLWGIMRSNAKIFTVGDYNQSLDAHLVYQVLENELFQDRSHVEEVSYIDKKGDRVTFDTKGYWREMCYRTLLQMEKLYLFSIPYDIEAKDPHPSHRYLKLYVLRAIEEQIRLARGRV